MAIPPAAVGAMPANVARHENVMPVNLEGGTLTVAVEDLENFRLLDRLRFVCNCRIKAVGATAIAIRCAVTRYYGPSDD